MLEIERRWLVDLALVGDLSSVPYRIVEDLYVTGTRLRLRKITDANGVVQFKFGKKYGKRSRLVEPITSLFLTEAEYGQLSSLPGLVSSKRRYSIASGSLDIHPPPVSGVAIFEMEFESETSASSYQPPRFATTEVTGDPAFSAYSLAGGHAQ